MDSGTNSCACKGIRTCLICEPAKGFSENKAKPKDVTRYEYCYMCEKAWESSGAAVDQSLYHPDHSGKSIDFPGIFLSYEFICESEETFLDKEINKTSWVDSQSGRRKQDYGPKVNFKKKKIKPSVFTGLPSFSARFYDKMKTLPILQDFLPVELCNLEYIAERGSAIDPHFDDFWLWGERLVTLNLINDTILTMTKDDLQDIEVAVPMPRRSLIVVYGPSRYEWKHAVKRQDVCGRRLAITFRELTPEFLAGGEKEKEGKELLDIALTFEGSAVG